MKGRKYAAITGVSIAAIVFLVLFQTGQISFQQQQTKEPIAPTQDNLTLFPQQTQDMKHLARTSEVLIITVEPESVDPSNQDYELLLTLVDPDGNMVFSKFITEPFYQELRPIHSGWHALTITNVGETQTTSVTRIETHLSSNYGDSDSDIPVAQPCNVPPYLEDETDMPYPWC